MSDKTRSILVVEDDLSILTGLSMNLRIEGYEVLQAQDGRTGLARALDESPDLMVLDVMLPELNGFEVLKELRQRGRDTPVVVLSAKGMETDKILGLNLGADDYVVKPFHLFELRKRIEAVLRRAAPQRRDGGVDDVRGLTLHVASGQIEYQGQRARLTRSEVGILQVLMGQPGRTHSAAELSGRVWGYEQLPDANFVQQHVSRLRRKLATLGAEGVIETVYGVGYTIATTPPDDPPPPASRPDAPSEG